MIPIRATVLAVAATLATAAGAESNTMTGSPGFFQPTPDGNSSISRIVPRQDDAVVAQLAPAPAAQPNAVAAPVVASPEPSPEEKADQVRKAEADLDRAEREHREMSERTAQNATTFQGAFTGLTSERDR